MILGINMDCKFKTGDKVILLQGYPNGCAERDLCRSGLEIGKIYTIRDLYRENEIGYGLPATNYYRVVEDRENFEFDESCFEFEILVSDLSYLVNVRCF